MTFFRNMKNGTLTKDVLKFNDFPTFSIYIFPPVLYFKEQEIFTVGFLVSLEEYISYDISRHLSLRTVHNLRC